jgi:hypothetical protein
MHRDDEAAFPPACLHYLLELVRNAARGRDNSTPFTPADTVAAFRRAVRADFGGIFVDVLGLQLTPRD